MSETTNTEPTSTDTPTEQPAKPAARKPRARKPAVQPTTIEVPPTGHKGCTHGPGAPRRACRETRAAEYFAAVAAEHQRVAGVDLTRKIVAELIAADEHGLSTATTTVARAMRLLAEQGAKITK